MKKLFKNQRGIALIVWTLAIGFVVATVLVSMATPTLKNVIKSFREKKSFDVEKTTPAPSIQSAEIPQEKITPSSTPEQEAKNVFDQCSTPLNECLNTCKNVYLFENQGACNNEYAKRKTAAQQPDSTGETIQGRLP